ncbi:HD-GYP domain-containing protein [Luteimonas sp. e5]
MGTYREIEEQEISGEELAIGMFVSRLDRDWIQTPFPLQGVLIKSSEDIAMLRRHAQRFWIDVERSRVVPAAGPRRHGLAPRSSGAGAAPKRDLQTFQQELVHGTRMLDKVSVRAAELMEKWRRGEMPSLEDVDEVVQPVVESLGRNPDAYFWLEALRSRHHYTYRHAVNCCALAAAFGRHLGFDDARINALATGALLLDIGMGAVPPEILNQAGPLDELGQTFVERHVREGLDRLRESGIDDPLVVEMMAGHHERFDGSGYPAGKRGDQIPLSARIAALVDSFDALISDRPYRKALSRAQALQELVASRDSAHDGALVEEFVRCFGVYPVGTLVELNTGEVGVVMAQNPEQRLRPRLLMLTNPQKQQRSRFVAVDLLDTARNPALQDVHIQRALAPGSYGLDIAQMGI